ncbi:ABC transporter ATP-binding protein [Zoogloea dura]|uniref:Dipeptide ABC transporter ATP-binding protein n=1 Tax=Zoogloea dura TaxID=2728840 RepID=A0A848FZS0_9RHOO|nr:dipeptide ABC transporter ATP-binding protein [Zoogloea dura]NML24250.1 dipeptide ABC transporter ATP-binding protein [Zoogloea dura]
MNTLDKEGQALLRVDGLRVELGPRGKPVRPVDGVSFQVLPGQTLALVGESGCGKSMTALACMRLLPAGGRIAGGSIRLGDEALEVLPETRMRDVRGKHLAMIFQEPATSLNPVMTVGDQIGEVLVRHRGLHGQPAWAEAEKLLEAVGIPDPRRRLSEYPFQLSGGMKQRVMIAMALAGDPDVLIADEPTTALDVTIQAQVLDLLRDLQNRRGMGMLLITHDLGVVARMAHRIGVMYAGELVETGDREDFFGKPLHPYSRKLFAALPTPDLRGRPLETIVGQVPRPGERLPGCRFAERCPQVREVCRSTLPGLHQVGQQAVRCHLYDPDLGLSWIDTPPPVASVAGEQTASRGKVLDVADLKVHFPVRKGIFRRVAGHVKAVDGVTLQVPAGQTLALVGESGCGKTTAGKALLKLVQATGGEVRYGGQEVLSLPASRWRPLRRDLQMIFQDPFSSLDPRMRVGEILEEGMQALGVESDAAARAERIEALLNRVGLDPAMRYRFPHEFSGGQRQRIAIARALAVSPSLIVCDEPTSALDVSVQAQILNLLRELQAEYGLSYLFITHNLAVVDYLAHQVAVMYLGRIVEQGSTEEVLREPRHPYTRMLLAAVPRVDVAGDALPAPAIPHGDMPSALNPPSGCHFHPRCEHASDICRSTYPAETRLSGGRMVRCYLYDT